ncbi:hypothetical protein MSAN_01522700 [Mycena sanguinolenta]|uniref:Uncharacterized protein n=1 Tax=Mycena sanguinolenta TaxID=230812 RepID=A0A8H6Y7N1_9AGAR|nr:hypothetical protein MSAN_01522700 [Mycena sanguinolenta]
MAKHVAKYALIRHPNIMQLYGLGQFLRRFRHSSVLTTYIMPYCGTEFNDAIDYLSCALHKPLMDYYDLPTSKTLGG